MRALILPSLTFAERPDPIPGEGQLLVRVRAAGLNRADLVQRAGKYPAPPGWPADIPGLEYAGEVAAIGPGVTYFAPGERVMGLVGGGAMAELVVVDQTEALVVPEGMPLTDAAAIPEAFLTAWDALVRQGRAVVGDRVLVHAIGSGVGTAAAQLARVLDLTLIGTSRTPDKLARCRELGMSHGVLTTPPPQGGPGQSEADWTAQVGDPVDVIVDTLGARFLDANLNLLARHGRLVVLGLLTGRIAERFDMGLVLRNRLTIIGTAMRSRPLEERAELVTRFADEILPHFERELLHPVVDRVLPMAEAAAAYDLLASNATFGKLVLAMD
jgi:putative PIG3 family NAD(P)H quinone oxidoreductase